VRPARTAWALATAAAFGGAVLLALALVRPSFDLAYFLPAPRTLAEQVLTDRVGQGAGAQLLFIEIGPVADADAGALALALADALRAAPEFTRVEAGEPEPGLAALPAGVWRHRYLLADVDWSVAGLRAALEARLADLGAAGGSDFAALVAADPGFAALDVLGRLRPAGAGAGAWVDGDQAVLVAETRAPAFDIGAQRAALAAIDRAFAAVAPAQPPPRVAGVGAYSAAIDATVQREAAWLGGLATAAALLVITLAYRSLPLTVLSMLPLAAAVLGGVLAAVAVFGTIHGITIAFGATLVGVVDDYPLHLFSHARHAGARPALRRIARTLVVSAATTLIAYAALVVGGSRGLAQLGVFSLAGIACALLVTCVVLPRLLPPVPSLPPDPRRQEFRLRPWPCLLLLLAAGGLLAAAGGLRWSDDLGAATPLPAEVLARDRALRARLQAPELRYLVSVEADSLAAVIAATEAVRPALAAATQAGEIRGFVSPDLLVPGEATQARRRAAIPPPAELEARLAAASAGLPFRPGAFAPFLAAAAAARTGPWVGPADHAGDFTGSLLAGQLVTTARGLRADLAIYGLADPAALDRRLAGLAGRPVLVDLKDASQSLVRGYRERLARVLGIAVLAIAALLAWHTRSVARFAWSLGTVAGAVLLTLAAVNLVGGSVSIFNAIGLVLVAGLGVDYCLFYSRPEVSPTEFRDARHAVVAGAGSTTGAFAILATSSVPLLAAMGLTVALGTAIAFGLARLGCRPVSSPPAGTLESPG
jgi:predicted exporter